MSEDNEDGNDWDFKIEGVKTESENSERIARKERLAKKLNQEEEKRDAKKDLIGSAKPKKMTLGESSADSRRSRSKVAADMRAEERPDFSDLMASPIKRGMAFMIDAAIFIGIYIAASFQWEKIELYSLNFLREAGIDQPLDPEVFKVVIMSLIACAAYFVILALPVLFSHKSWGKSVIGLSIQSSDEEKSLTFLNIIFREFIAKPISLATVIGPLILLFNSDKRSLHDLVAGTVVMDDKFEVGS
jgi:uncharacterized RDD family membrane protein YckC